MDLLSLRLVGVVGAKINVRSLLSQQGIVVYWIQIQVFMVASPALLTTELSRHPNQGTCGYLHTPDTELSRHPNQGTCGYLRVPAGTCGYLHTPDTELYHLLGHFLRSPHIIKSEMELYNLW